MGKNTLDELMGLTHDQKLKDEMMRQKREYRRFNQAAHGAGCHRGRGPRPERRCQDEREHGHPHPDDDGQIDPQPGHNAGRGQRPGCAGLQARRERLPTASPGPCSSAMNWAASKARPSRPGAVSCKKPSPLGEGDRRPDEGRACRYNPFMGNNGKPAPHQSASQTASPSGSLFTTISDRPL